MIAVRHVLALALCALSLAPAHAQDAPPAGDPPPAPTGDTPPAPQGGDAPAPGGGDTPPPGGETPPAPGGDAPAPARPRRNRPGRDADPSANPAVDARGNRRVDRDSDMARRLDELLAVDPRYAVDGTVELIYVFNDDALAADWELTGFDRAEEGAGARGRARPDLNRNRGRNLSLGASSSGPGGLMLHKLTFIDDYEVSVRSHVVRSSGRADFVVLAGKGGASWGTQLVQRGGSGFTALARTEASRDAWDGGRSAEVTLTVREGARIELSLDGRALDSSTKLEGKLDGRVGLWMRDMHLLVERITIKGRIDPSKLD